MSTPVDLSIIVPTRNEEANIAILLRRIEEAVSTFSAEVLVVDDSEDGTEAAAHAAAERSPLPIRVIHRSGAERWGGLGGAVCDGFRSASGTSALVMDGDLQHPPGLIPEMYRQASESGAGMVVASRYLRGGSAAGLSGAYRRWISRLSVTLTRSVFPLRLRSCSDPMSGFFLVRLGEVEVDRMSPRGYKILLEILARHRLSVVEVPFDFGQRLAGSSKTSVGEGARFLRQLLGLRLSSARPSLRRPVIDLDAGVRPGRLQVPASGRAEIGKGRPRPAMPARGGQV